MNEKCQATLMRVKFTWLDGEHKIYNCPILGRSTINPFSSKAYVEIHSFIHSPCGS